MDPVTQSAHVSRTPSEVFDYLADVANHPEFLDHFTSEWHLTREDTYGLGAGVRYAIKMRGNRFPWVDQTVIECDAPRRLVLAGRGGKFNRIRTLTVYEVEPSGSNGSRVTVTFETEGKYPSDRLFDRRGYYKRRLGKALRRVSSILEDDHDRGTRASIAGGARKPATGTPLR
ncbi:SRPBCC family protein [Paraconexibacter antarcticus]|uniref:SRPBCC family protein n=1 Tax=Paraconexibacter antarcticus TaxID=2949664 RepID=A0ABY5DZD3_9ACTN|nr:SRPBCC family protein [Paraconexibacter antarcticus]UTI66571.1 SRPBCC family protein [Paraconexibacter antarcticus]